MQNFFDCDYPTALGIVHDLMTQRMQQFEHVVAHELPGRVRRLRARRPRRARSCDGYVVDLQNWMAGILNWHREVDRYKADWLSGRAHGFLPDRAPVVPVG